MTDEGIQSRSLSGAEEFAAALKRLVAQSRRQLCIYSDTLPRPLYCDPQVIETVSDFARNSRYAQVRILIRDTDPLLHRPHQLLALAQRLTSRIEIRRIHASVDTPDWEFALGDDRRLIYSSDATQWRGVYEPENRARVRQLLDVFERSWPLAMADANLRRLQL